MIRVNLLPPELRTLEKTPLIRFIIIIAGAALTTAALFFFLFLQFSTLPAAIQKRDDVKKDIKQKKVLAAKYDELEQEIQFFKLRVDAVKKLRKERYIWSKKLFQLHRVIEETEHVALNSISIEKEKSTARRGAGTPKMAIVMDGYSIIPELRSAANFMMNLRNSEFFKDCESIKIGTTVIRTEKDSEVCEFSLRVVMKPLEIPPPAAAKRGAKKKRRAK